MWMQIYSSFPEQLFEFHFPIILQMMELNNKRESYSSGDEKASLIFFLSLLKFEFFV
jgi:hypothetical protein